MLLQLRYGPVVECCTEEAYHKHHSPRLCFLPDSRDETTCILCGKSRQDHYRQKIDDWATSAALLYSAIVKLARISKDETVYRGVKEEYVQLPESFTSRGVDGFAGGVEVTP